MSKAVPRHFTTEELHHRYNQSPPSPKDVGRLELITRRPDNGEREVLEIADLSKKYGLVGDNWYTRGSSRTEDGSAHPDMQITLMNSRVIEVITEKKVDWKLAGDQFFVDLDLSHDNLPTATQLQLGSAVIEITEQPHTGCGKFMKRFGKDALRFVSTDTAKALRMRGVNCRVVRSGVVKLADKIKVIPE